MKKLLSMAVAVLLVSGVGFAGGKKCSGKDACCKKEGKSCQKEKKPGKTTTTTPAPTSSPSSTPKS